MKKNLIKISIFLFTIFCGGSVFASYNDIDQNTVKVYEIFYKKVSQISKNNSWLEYLKYLGKTLDTISNSSKINSTNAKKFLDLKKLNNEKIFEIEYNNFTAQSKNKIKNLTYLSNFKNIVYNNYAISYENWVWYAYLFKEKLFTKEYKNLTKESLQKNNVYETALVFFNVEEDSINFVNSYKKVKLVSNDVIYWFPNKLELLKTIKWNKEKYTLTDNDNGFLDIEKVSLEITKNVYKNDEKISIIYDYLLKNLQYPESVDFDDYKLFSWIEAFKWKIAVCEWYVELFNLMLWFNGISSKIIIWNVVNALDYPEVLHAWTKVGDYYYDPTFDDPIWNTKEKTKDKYLFFKIPEDLFYTDRFDYDVSPEYLKDKSLEYREKFVENNLLLVYPKYKNSNYKILDTLRFKDKYGISLSSNITIESLKNIMQYWTLKNSSLTINWTVKSVKTMKYILLEEDKIEAFLELANYDLSSYYLIYWVKDWEEQYITVETSEIEFN